MGLKAGRPALVSSLPPPFVLTPEAGRAMRGHWDLGPATSAFDIQLSPHVNVRTWTGASFVVAARVVGADLVSLLFSLGSAHHHETFCALARRRFEVLDGYANPSPAFLLRSGNAGGLMGVEG